MCSVADCVTKYFFFFARARSQLRCFSASVWCGAAQTLFIFIRNFVCALRERFFLSVQHSDVMMMMFFHVVKNVGGCFVKDWFLFKWTENRMIRYFGEEISTSFFQSHVNVKLNDNGVKWSDCSCWFAEMGKWRFPQDEMGCNFRNAAWAKKNHRLSAKEIVNILINIQIRGDEFEMQQVKQFKSWQKMILFRMKPWRHQCLPYKLLSLLDGTVTVVILLS